MAIIPLVKGYPCGEVKTKLKVVHTKLNLQNFGNKTISLHLNDFVNANFTSSASYKSNKELGQFISDLDENAHQKNWTSLDLDVWVAGEKKPSGVYISYVGHEKNSSVIGGGLFIFQKVLETMGIRLVPNLEVRGESYMKNIQLIEPIPPGCN